MNASFARSLDLLSEWRSASRRRVDDLARFLTEHELTDAAGSELLASVQLRLATEKLVVAFVAEFSRGKSELINAIFFADLGRRVLPATPGRTTMCPVELGYDALEDAALALLPIATRLEGSSLSELRAQPRHWTHVPLHGMTADQLAQALLEVTRTQWVDHDEARALGFWDDDRPDDNPPQDAAGRVEVPAWRHALINYPHPLLRQGLVVLDTPGLNALGAEPELTLGLLPSAHAAVFVLGADTGVTQSDMDIWRDHLGTHSVARFVVLNKIDTLRDPLASAAQVDAQIDAQQAATARTLNIPLARVFPLSARQALAARVNRDAAGLVNSRLPELESALSEQLLPQRRAVLQQALVDAGQQVESLVVRRLGDSRRQLMDQILELRGLRGKSGSKVVRMLDRVETETAEFELCTARLQALRVVHTRMLKDMMVGISSDRLREEVLQMQTAMNASVLNLGAKKAFIGMCHRLHSLLTAAQARGVEIRAMLGGSFERLNAEFGFALALPDAPSLVRFENELHLIERNYVQYLGLTQALRLSQPKFMEQFRRMLVSKLRVVFESASSELEMWNKAASGLVDSQLRERRRGFRRRRESLERIQSAAGELELRLAELEMQDRRLQGHLARVGELTHALRGQAAQAPAQGDAGDLIQFDCPDGDEPGIDEPEPALLRRVPA